MSIKSYLQTVEAVLESERERRRKLIIFRPGARRGYEEVEREIELPNMGTAVFSLALGAVMTGMHAVLDLREDVQCADWLEEALFSLPGNACPAITMLIGAQEATMVGAIGGVQRLCPKTPRQAAGFLRAALHCEGMTMLVLDEEYFDIMDDVPDEADFVLLPVEDEAQHEFEEDDWEDISGEAQQMSADAAEDIASDEAQSSPSQSTSDENEGIKAENAEETAQGENQVMQTEHADKKPTAFKMNMCATRMMSYNPERLDALCKELDAPLRTLIEKCVLRVYERFPSFECRYEDDAVSSECAFLPPEQENAAIWVGRDRISIAYDAAKVSHDTAARTLRETCRLLNKPTLLIYDGEENAQ